MNYHMFYIAHEIMCVHSKSQMKRDIYNARYFVNWDGIYV